ncbi:hypothetical protein yc1106_09382 [Curvularia clavata]|uniref:Heterokaryon incompatibility domain-containing protein n=1 Tax=Curvularia clavata TaxID=95742 RepID=A0A9Q8ZK15_CURCL|nr:hypothetical protein yc1106_09382 [Curvularia clavata]
MQKRHARPVSQDDYAFCLRLDSWVDQWFESWSLVISPQGCRGSQGEIRHAVNVSHVNALIDMSLTYRPKRRSHVINAKTIEWFRQNHRQIVSEAQGQAHMNRRRCEDLQSCFHTFDDSNFQVRWHTKTKAKKRETWQNWKSWYRQQFSHDRPASCHFGPLKPSVINILNFVIEINQKRSPHKPLTPGEFRLLRHSTTTGDTPMTFQLENIKIAVLPKDLQYTALSYRWASMDLSRAKIIFLNSMPFVVNSKLFNMLLYVTQHASRQGYLWLDALCIRQDEEDSAEKSVQISLMGEIYKKANSVDIWLGDNYGSANLIEDLKRWGSEGILQRDVTKEATKLLDNPWFQRLWIVQELVLARPGAAFLVVRDRRMAWDSFAAVMHQIAAYYDKAIRNAGYQVSLFDSKDSRFPFREEIDSNRLERFNTNFDRNYAIAVVEFAHHFKQSVAKRLMEIRQMYISRGIRDSHEELLHLARDGQVSNPHDRVYALLGLFPTILLPGLTVDYAKQPWEVYRDFTVSKFASQSLTRTQVDLYCGPLVPLSMAEKCPSWVLDLSKRRQSMFLDKTQFFSTLNMAEIPDGYEILLNVSAESYEFPVPAVTIDQIATVIKPPKDLPALFSKWEEGMKNLMYKQVVDKYGNLCKVDDGVNPFRVALLTRISEFLSQLDHCYSQGRALANEYDISYTIPLWQIVIPPAVREPEGKPVVSAHLLSDMFNALTQGIPESAECYRKDKGRSETTGSLTLEDKHACFLSPGDQNPYNTIAQVIVIAIVSFFTERYQGSQCQFFMTKHGLCGLSKPGAQVGDHVAVLWHGVAGGCDVPFVIRERDDGCYSLVAPMYVPDDWKTLAEFRGTREPEIIIIK